MKCLLGYLCLLSSCIHSNLFLLKSQKPNCGDLAVQLGSSGEKCVYMEGSDIAKLTNISAKMALLYPESNAITFITWPAYDKNLAWARSYDLDLIDEELNHYNTNLFVRIVGSTVKDTRNIGDAAVLSYCEQCDILQHAPAQNVVELSGDILHINYFAEIANRIPRAKRKLFQKPPTGLIMVVCNLEDSSISECAKIANVVRFIANQVSPNVIWWSQVTPEEDSFFSQENSIRFILEHEK